MSPRRFPEKIISSDFFLDVIISHDNSLRMVTAMTGKSKGKASEVKFRFEGSKVERSRIERSRVERSRVEKSRIEKSRVQKPRIKNLQLRIFQARQLLSGTLQGCNCECKAARPEAAQPALPGPDNNQQQKTL